MTGPLDFAIGGSGSVFIQGYIDAHYKTDFSEKECFEFLQMCISLACFRDGSSGGCFRAMKITKEGCERTYKEYESFPIK